MSNEFADLGAPSVQAQVDPAVARLGDLVTLSIRVSHPPALNVDPPSFSKSLGAFEVYSSTRLAAETAADKAVDRFEATLQSFTTGQLTLPGLEVPYRDPMGKTQFVKTPELTVTIQEIPAGPKDKEGEIRGIKDVVGPTAWSPWWWLVAAVLVLAVGALLWRKRQRALIGPPPPPPIPPDILALEKLKRLEQSDWLATGKIKEFHSEISDIVRAYVEGRYGTPALERTTGELLRDLRKTIKLPADMDSALRDLLSFCDLVKFAKFRPEITEAQQAHQAAVKFVETTRAPKESDELRKP